jgi:glycosyltransferase involved in cell wall biosynthesis
MNVFMCFDELAPHFGPGTLVTALAPALQRAGHRVVVFVERPVDPRNQYLNALRRAGIPVHAAGPLTAAAARWTRLEELLLTALLPVRVPLAAGDALLRNRGWRRAWRGVRGRMNGLLPSVQLADPPRRWLRRALDREHRRRPAHLVHMLTGKGSAFAWAADRRVPIVYNENIVPSAAHGVDWWSDVRRHIGDVRLTASLCAAAEPAIRDFLGYRGPVVVVPSSIADPLAGGALPIARDAALAGHVIVGAAGRLTAVKGFDVLLQALRVVVGREPDAAVQLWIAGEGPERAALEALTASLGLTDRVRFLGHCGPAAMARFWSAVDVFALSSRWEGLPYVILEAMAHAKPVIATTVDGIPEAVVDGETGLLVPPDAVDPLAAALGALLDDGGRRAALGTAGRARFLARFETDVVLDRLLDAYRQVVPHAA